MEFLSNIELYFSSSVIEDEKKVHLNGNEFYHCTKVMRNKTGDDLYVTDGNGSIFFCKISAIAKEDLTAGIITVYKYADQLKNVTFCIPNLKNPERLKFAIEKCVELGITSFNFFLAEHSISKKFNRERIEKIILSAMKQSLRSFLPAISISGSVSELLQGDAEIIMFDQTSELKFDTFKLSGKQGYKFLFGPEGGFSESEYNLLKEAAKFRLTENRLRSETAIIKAASMLG